MVRLSPRKPRFVVVAGGQDLSDSEHIRESGELTPEAMLLRRCGLVGRNEDQDDSEEIEDDRDRDVDVVIAVESDETDAGEDVRDVLVRIGSS